MSKIGVGIVEREAADANRVTPSDLFSVGMVCMARRGPVGVAIPVYNVNDDKKAFGDFGSAFLGGYVRRGLFNNCKEYGTKILVVRVAHSDATTASKTFQDGAGTPADTWTFKSGYLGLDSPGADGLNVSVEIKESLADTSKRDVLVYYQGPHDSVPVLKETFEYLNNSNVVDVINSKSVFVKVALNASTLVAAVAARAALATGADGTEALAESDYGTALAALDGQDCPMIMIPDFQTVDAATALQTYVEGRGDTIGIINAPLSASLATLTTDYAALLKTRSSMVGYRGWGHVDSEFGGRIQVPLMGHAVGAAWIRKCVQRGGFPWVAPAGPDTALLDVIDVDVPLYSDGDLDTCVRTIGFNPIMFVAGKSFIVRTSRTFSTMRKYYSAHVRRMTNYFKISFRNSFMWVEQEPNNVTTRRRISDSLTFFAKDCYRNGAFSTRGGYDNNVSIKCDEENNTQDMEDAGQMACDYVFHPVEAVESATINIFQTRDGLVVSEK